jgi:hypothetical protein
MRKIALVCLIFAIAALFSAPAFSKVVPIRMSIPEFKELLAKHDAMAAAMKNGIIRHPKCTVCPLGDFGCPSGYVKVGWIEKLNGSGDGWGQDPGAGGFYNAASCDVVENMQTVHSHLKAASCNPVKKK